MMTSSLVTFCDFLWFISALNLYYTDFNNIGPYFFLYHPTILTNAYWKILTNNYEVSSALRDLPVSFPFKVTRRLYIYYIYIHSSIYCSK